MKRKQVKAHFRKVDPIIHKVLVEMDFEPLPPPLKPASYFSKLCREIIAQQLASKAARAIIGRFYDLFDSKRITPDKVLAFSEEDLRKVGMSWAKARYIRDLAQKTKDREVKLHNLHLLEDKQVVAELIKVKGIGPWTAEMFLIFTLSREDIFSHGDLGLRKALYKLYRLRKPPSEKRIENIVKH